MTTDINNTWTIEAINDTRTYDFETGKPIPGTGEPIPCECCGKEIQVHVTVRNKDRSQVATIGTQCSKRAGHRFYVGGNDLVSPTNKNWWKRRYSFANR